MAVTRWIPLESNPEVLNRFASVIGLNVTSVTFCDVFGLDKVSSRSVHPTIIRMQDVAWWCAPQSQTQKCGGVTGHGVCDTWRLTFCSCVDVTSCRYNVGQSFEVPPFLFVDCTKERWS